MCAVQTRVFVFALTQPGPRTHANTQRTHTPAGAILKILSYILQATANMPNTSARVWAWGPIPRYSSWARLLFVWFEISVFVSNIFTVFSQVRYFESFLWRCRLFMKYSFYGGCFEITFLILRSVVQGFYRSVNSKSNSWV